MYLETRDVDETMKIYMAAWEKGLKSTYYLHMKPRHSAEQSTVKVNKAEKLGYRGFGSVAKAAAPAAAIAPAVAVASTYATEHSSGVLADGSVPSPVEMMPSSKAFAKVASVVTSTPSAPEESFINITKKMDLPKVDVVEIPKVAVPIVETPKAEARMVIKRVEPTRVEMPARTETPKVIEIPKADVVTKTEIPVVEKGPLSATISISMPKKQKDPNAPKVCPIDPAELAQCDSCQ